MDFAENEWTVAKNEWTWLIMNEQLLTMNGLG